MQVQKILHQRNYRFQYQRGCGIRLTAVNSKERFRETGQFKRTPLTPVSTVHLNQILRMAENAEQAADQIEAISLGKQFEPNMAKPGNMPGLDNKTIERIVETRTQHAMADASEQYQKMIAQQRSEMEDLRVQLEELRKATEKKKPGRPKGSRTSVVEKAAQIAEMPPQE